MRKIIRILGISLSTVILLILIAGLYVKFFLPNVGPAGQLKIVSSPAKVERGKYLASHVMVCMDCHGTRQWGFYAGPMKEDSLGMGGELFDRNAGFPGKMYAANITPSGIGDWTDGEVFRAITTGVRKNGKPIFPVMPHENYGKLDPEDIEAIICYVRSLPAIEHKVPESEYDFPMNFIINTIPAKAHFSKRPDSSEVLKYGQYMATSASCGVCHTPFEKGSFDTAFSFAGGRSFNLPAGVLTSANLTMDKETGIGNWTKEMFIDRFRAFRDSAYAHREVDFTKDMTTVMPWPVYAGMTDNDLGAIFTFLQSLKPISHRIVKFTPSVVAN
ncbi:MAG: cytochrome C [Flavitalea sp.]